MFSLILDLTLNELFYEATCIFYLDEALENLWLFIDLFEVVSPLTTSDLLLSIWLWTLLLF
jgi:hypothetical protein